MGIKASTANGGGQQSPRTRTFSTSSSSGGGTGFNILRTGTNGIQSNTSNRMRPRSLSSVPHHNNHSNHDGLSLSHVPGYEISSASPETDSSSTEENAASSAASLALGRVYTATSLPAHIFSLNGEFEKKFF